MLSRHSVRWHQGNELTHNAEVNTCQKSSSQLAEPLWTDLGLKSRVVVCKLIYTHTHTHTHTHAMQAGIDSLNIPTPILTPPHPPILAYKEKRPPELSPKQVVVFCQLPLHTAWRLSDCGACVFAVGSEGVGKSGTGEEDQHFCPAGNQPHQQQAQ